VPSASPKVTIVRQRPGCVETPWVRFLLGEHAGEAVDDPDRTLVEPHSLILCDRLQLLAPEVLDRIRSTPGVGLYQTSDEWYRGTLEVYDAFNYVWRQHFHTGLKGRPVRQLPLPPAALDGVTAEPRPEASRPASERPYLWSFAGQLKSTRFKMLAALRQAGEGAEHITGTFDEAVEPIAGDAYLRLLADSVFVPCPMGNVHLESFRAYEAIELGAIPVVERRPWLDYHRELLGDHPLPTVRSWSEAPALIGRLRADPVALDELQGKIVAWWTARKRVLAAGCRSDVERAASHPEVRFSGSVPGRWRGRLEMLRHHDATAAWARARMTAQRLRDHGSVRQA
jgi:hypothetical protein